jgi:CheY-like chemotaxis protein
VDEVQPAIERFQHTLRIESPADPVVLYADPTRVAQMIANLLSNAAKFTPPKGQIVLAIAADDASVEIAVTDDGRGIEPADVDRIFERFSVGDGRSQGLGMGLSVTRWVAEKHGGSVAVESAGLNQGSRFTIVLPRGNPSAEGESPAEGRDDLRPASRPHRVMIVDDSRDGADGFARILKMIGHDVLVCYDGASALERGERFAPDMVLMDIGMPGMSGHEAARRLRECAWGRNVLLVALTGFGQAEDRSLSREAGFDYHLVKPIEVATLLELIDNQLD